MADPIEELGELLRVAGARVTFDSGRDITHPCTFCGKSPETVHELVDIGTYPNGDVLTRPVCKGCKPRAAAHCRPRPIPMALYCPKCSTEHVDRDEWVRKPHRVHLCEGCQNEWEAADFDTVGIAENTEESQAEVHYENGDHDGPGWYYHDAEYPEEGVVGSFESFEAAARHAAQDYYRVCPPRLMRPAAGKAVIDG